MDDKTLRYGIMETSASASQPQNLLMDTNNCMCAIKSGNVLMESEAVKSRVKEIKRCLLDMQQESDTELAPNVVSILKCAVFGEKDSNEKEKEEEKNGENNFRLFRNNTAKHMW